MNSECTRFRERLVTALEPPRAAATFGVLGWHEHLLACAACRELLASEEALEALLDSLPEPKLPRELAERVLARLRLDDLDVLLERADAAVDGPALARRVLAGLVAERADFALERLLERVPAPALPAELAGRTLAKLALARRREAARWSPRTWLTTAAAAALVLGGAWVWRFHVRSTATDESKSIVENEPPNTPKNEAPKQVQRNVASRGELLDAPSDEFLASLPVLESWDLLNSPNIDVMLSNLDARDELLLELTSELDEPADESPRDSLGAPTADEVKHG
ncbi:MAG: hypothetical protein K8S98_00600 [Planctomycetes bacterium]|nr:hypothetical protein [Planctomycetota bacterium]